MSMATVSMDEFRLRVEEAPDSDVVDMLRHFDSYGLGAGMADRINVLVDECLVRGLTL